MQQMHGLSARPYWRWVRSDLALALDNPHVFASAHTGFRCVALHDRGEVLRLALVVTVCRDNVNARLVSVETHERLMGSLLSFI